MPTTRPVTERLQQELDQALSADALRLQNTAYRSWFRLLDKMRPAPTVPRETPSVPGYAWGGGVWNPLNRPKAPPPTGAGIGYDVIPGTGTPPLATMVVSPPPPAASPAQQQLAEILTPQTLDERQQYAFQNMTPEQAGMQKAAIVLRGVGPVGSYDTVDDALTKAREARATADRLGDAHIEVLEDGGLDVISPRAEAAPSHLPSPDFGKMRVEQQGDSPLAGLHRLAGPATEGHQDILLATLDPELRKQLKDLGFSTSVGVSPRDLPGAGAGHTVLPERQLASGYPAADEVLRHELGHQLLGMDAISEHRVLGLLVPVWNILQRKGVSLTQRAIQTIINAAQMIGFEGSAPVPGIGGTGGYPNEAENQLIQQIAPAVAQQIINESVPGFAQGGSWGGGLWNPLNRSNTPSAGAAFDVIPGKIVTPSFTVDQPSQDQIEAYERASYAHTHPGYDLIPGREPPPDSFTVAVTQTAQRLNPAASEYERARGDDPALRPTNIDSRLAEGFAGTDVFSRQRNAFMGLEPGTLEARAIAKLSDSDKEALVILAAALEKHSATAADVRRYLTSHRQFSATREPVGFALQDARETMQLLKEAKARVSAGADPAKVQEELAQTLEERETGGVTTQGSGILSPIVPLPEEAFAPLGPAAGPLHRAYDFASSPAGLATMGVAGVAGQGLPLAEGFAGQVGAGTAANAVGIHGKPRAALELAGAVAGPTLAGRLHPPQAGESTVSTRPPDISPQGLDVPPSLNTEAVPSAASAAPAYYHGTAGELEGGLREGSFLTPVREDAETYARTQARISGQEPRVYEVEAKPEAVKPYTEGVAGSRGAVTVSQPEGVRVVGEAGTLPAGARTPSTVEYLRDDAGNILTDRHGKPLPAISGGNPVQRLRELLDQAIPLREETDKLRSIERGKRTAAAAKRAQELIDQGVPYQEAYRRSTGELRGQYPTAAFTPPEVGLTKAQVQDLYSMVHNHKGLLYFTRNNTNEALTKLLAGQLPQPNEIKLLRRVFGAELTEAILKHRPVSNWEQVASLLNMPRALQATADLSAPFRQGLMLVGRPQFWKAMPAMVKSFASENVANAVDDALRAGQTPVSGRSWDEVMQRGNLYLAERGSAELSAHEEAFMSRLLAKIPGLGHIVRGSERAYVTFLNKLRGDTFKAIISKWEMKGIEYSDKDVEELGHWLNLTTGRGDLPGDWTPMLNTIMFSPKLLAARLETGPVAAKLLLTNGRMRGEVARDLVSTVGFGLGVLGMSQAGAEAYERATGKKAPIRFQLDPRSSDFGKVHFQNTRIDPWGGYQPIARYMAQIITGQGMGAHGAYNLDRKAAFTRFLQSKLSPIAGIGADIWTGKTFMGEEVTPTKSFAKTQIYNRLTPLFIQDVVDAVKEYGAQGIGLAPLGGLGMGIQTYTSMTDKRDAALEEAVRTGKLTGGYKGVPEMRDITNQDWQYLNKTYPDLFANEFATQQQKTLAGVSDRERAALRGEGLDQDRAEREQRIQKLLSDIRQTPSLGEQDTRKLIYDQIADIRNDYGAQVHSAFTDIEPDTIANGAVEALVIEARALDKKYEERFTTPDPDKREELWAAYDREYAQAFTADEQKKIDQELGVNKPAFLKAYDAKKDAADPYYDLPENAKDKDKEAWRAANPAADAALWLLGRVSVVRSRRAQQLAAEYMNDVFGTRLSPQDVATPKPKAAATPRRSSGFGNSGF